MLGIYIYIFFKRSLLQYKRLNTLFRKFCSSKKLSLRMWAKTVFSSAFHAGFEVLEAAPDSHKFKLTMFQPTDPPHFYRTVRKEMKLLKTSLPLGIWVRGYEDRMVRSSYHFWFVHLSSDLLPYMFLFCFVFIFIASFEGTRCWLFYCPLFIMCYSCFIYVVSRISRCNFLSLCWPCDTRLCLISLWQMEPKCHMASIHGMCLSLFCVVYIKQFFVVRPCL